VVNENKNGKVVAFWIEKNLLRKMNKLVETKKMKSRSAVINLALREFLKRTRKK